MISQGFSANTFEKLFDTFVCSWRGGRRLDEMFDNKLPEGTKCADYFFPTERVIVELKTLNENHGYNDLIIRLVGDELVRKGYPLSLRDEWQRGRLALPKAVTRKVDEKVQNSLKKAVRKANEQIMSAQNLLGERCDTLLIVANLNEFLFGSVELLRNLAGHALGRSSLRIDSILLITPGVQYATRGGIPQHHIIPVYDEGKQHLGDFVEPLAEAWIDFEARSLGVVAEIEKVFDLDEDSKFARPVDSAP